MFKPFLLSVKDISEGCSKFKSVGFYSNLIEIEKELDKYPVDKFLVSIKRVPFEDFEIYSASAIALLI